MNIILRLHTEFRVILTRFDRRVGARDVKLRQGGNILHEPRIVRLLAFIVRCVCTCAEVRRSALLRLHGTEAFLQDVAPRLER